MNKIEHVPFTELQKLEETGLFGFHGSPVAPDLLENHKGVPPQSLVPLHAPRCLDRASGLHKPRAAGRLAAVSFFDSIPPAAARSLFHANNHTALPQTECLSGYTIDNEGGLHLSATSSLLEDVSARGSELTGWLYGHPTATLQRSPDNPHDFWSDEPLVPEVVTRIDGTFVQTLASLCATGEIEIIPPFKPDFNNC